ncbi:MAG: GNAT family N-acetyltransferase [Oscillospiraceae bacterium]|jgi:GNAT superfamily N-acetyltransferase|nr:GNAT family N-acetyltransferase [Oscillospiraceae bacterium]
MNITYNDERKDLPADQLHELFVSVGWSPDGALPDEWRKGFMQPWRNSTLVVSAWDGDRLAGAVRVLSDTIFRSVIYDLLVSPAYRGQGIGKGLVNRCKAHFPNSEWLVGCDKKNSEFYKKLGFREILKTGEFLVIPCKLF